MKDKTLIERPELLDPRKEKRPWALMRLLYLLLALVVIFLAGLLLVSALCLNVSVVGSSMEDTIPDGSQLYAEKYRGQADRGDVVVIDVTDLKAFHAGGNTVYIIKRLIAVEGDKIRIGDGKVYITYAGTDEEVPYPDVHANGETDARPQFFGGEIVREWTLKEGEIFVLGDNRTVSEDSRMVGPLERDRIIGVVYDWNFSPATGWDAFSSPFIKFYLDIIRVFS